MASLARTASRSSPSLFRRRTVLLSRSCASEISVETSCSRRRRRSVVCGLSGAPGAGRSRAMKWEKKVGEVSGYEWKNSSVSSFTVAFFRTADRGEVSAVRARESTMERTDDAGFG